MPASGADALFAFSRDPLMPTRIAVDAMGGDKAPQVAIEGAMQAVQRSDGDLQVLLCGPANQLRQRLNGVAHGEDAGIDFIDAEQVIAMDESPVEAVRAKPRSSMHVGLGCVKRDRAHAFVSAGNTGALVAASVFVLGRLPGVSRPSIPTFYPTTKGMCLILDVGSNMDSKPEHLLQFGQMGAAFAQSMLHVDAPRVGLLSVGEEPTKGNGLVRAANQLLSSRASDLNFVGNVEGRDLLHHAADVVVCDGFVGNVVLKLTESVKTALPIMIQQELADLKLNAWSADAVRQVFSSLERRFDPDTYGGGAPLLGVKGAVFVLHGSSNASAFANAILLAASSASADMVGAVQGVVEQDPA